MRLRNRGVTWSLLITLLALFVLPTGALAGGGLDSRTRQPLLRVAGLENADDQVIKGEVRTRYRDDRQEFEVKVEYAVPDSSYDLWIDSNDDPAVDDFEFVGELEGDGSGKKYRARVREGRGGSLPLDATSVTELAGKPLQVRRGSVTVLEGRVGDSERAQQARWRDREELSRGVDFEADGARTRLRVRSRPRRGDERLEFKVNALTLPDGEGLMLYMEDPANPGGGVVAVGPFEAKRRGEWRYRVRTRKSQALPFGVASVRDLAGLAVEIRNSVTSDVEFDGLMPSP